MERLGCHCLLLLYIHNPLPSALIAKSHILFKTRVLEKLFARKRIQASTLACFKKPTNTSHLTSQPTTPPKLSPKTIPKKQTHPRNSSRPKNPNDTTTNPPRPSHQTQKRKKNVRPLNPQNPHLKPPPRDPPAPARSKHRHGPTRGHLPLVSRPHDFYGRRRRRTGPC